MTESIENNIRNRIYGHGRGWCFTIDHFSDFNNNEAVKKALQRLEQSSLIRRLAKGLYEYPRQHKKLGILPPEIEQIAKAISEKDNVRVQASGAYARVAQWVVRCSRAGRDAGTAHCAARWS